MTSRSATSVLAPPAPPEPAVSPVLGRVLLAEYLPALAALELLRTVYVPGAVAGLAFLALALCARLPLVGEQAAALLPVLVAVPVTRVVTEAVPGEASPARAAVAALALGVAVTAAARACPRDWLRLRGDTGWGEHAAVMLAGVPLGLLVHLLAPDLLAVTGGVPVLLAVALAAPAGLAAEVLFRGLLIPALAGVVGRWDVVVAAAIYASTFVSYGTPTASAALAVGLVLGWARRRTGSIAGVIGAYAVVMPLTVLVCRLVAES
ncbi:CPBP family intramembrane glutamic endopeptidase [Catellatospora bangladeshensis]|uniref:CAAX prenyl protease 2/Lysostaphin resistance protein A-like domain-containing protein n=1 Tax=Catellatospora bangladeshensis TaxID=310355 RepID=A0A8J3JK01_9ACTN|nr:CPBP family intramembrane glutamic endopeptidase [Catellatospora bangladeshensis]GIF83954.1 hypothetical protein Cba03nite_53030 [Catellatospora bangladeshensis]